LRYGILPGAAASRRARCQLRLTPNGLSASLDGQRITGHREAIAERLIGIGRTGFTVLNVALADAEERRRFAAEVMLLVRDRLTRPA